MFLVKWLFRERRRSYDSNVLESNILDDSDAAATRKPDGFLGVVGIDILLENLLDTVAGEVYGRAQIFVIEHDRHLLLHPNFNKNPNRKPIAAATAFPSELQPHLEKILQGKM
jgi:hypothetical protein